MFDNYIDFVIYLLYHTANADDNIDPTEKELIISKAGNYERAKEIVRFYERHNHEKRNDYVDRMKEKWLMTDSSKAEMLAKVREMIGSDFEIANSEKVVYKKIKNFLYE